MKTKNITYPITHIVSKDSTVVISHTSDSYASIWINSKVDSSEKKEETRRYIREHQMDGELSGSWHCIGKFYYYNPVVLNCKKGTILNIYRVATNSIKDGEVQLKLNTSSFSSNSVFVFKEFN